MFFQDKNCYNCRIFHKGTETFKGLKKRYLKWQGPFQAEISSFDVTVAGDLYFSEL